MDTGRLGKRKRRSSVEGDESESGGREWEQGQSVDFTRARQSQPNVGETSYLPNSGLDSLSVGVVEQRYLRSSAESREESPQVGASDPSALSATAIHFSAEDEQIGNTADELRLADVGTPSSASLISLRSAPVTGLPHPAAATAADRLAAVATRRSAALKPPPRAALLPGQKADDSAIVPRPYDVLLGRGKKHRNHPGNVRMQKIVDIHRDTYLKAIREVKTEISGSIVRIIKSSGDKSGRFLKFRNAQEDWVEVSDEVARSKVGHTIRDGSQTRSLQQIDSTTLEEIKPMLSDHVLQGLATSPLSALKPLAGQGLRDEEAQLLLELLSSSTPSPEDSKKPATEKEGNF